MCPPLAFFIRFIEIRFVAKRQRKKAATFNDCPHEADKLSGVSNEISYFEAHFDDVQQNEKDKKKIVAFMFNSNVFTLAKNNGAALNKNNRPETTTKQFEKMRISLCENGWEHKESVENVMMKSPAKRWHDYNEMAGFPVTSVFIEFVTIFRSLNIVINSISNGSCD